MKRRAEESRAEQGKAGESRAKLRQQREARENTAKRKRR